MPKINGTKYLVNSYGDKIARNYLRFSHLKQTAGAKDTHQPFFFIVFASIIASYTNLKRSPKVGHA